MEKAKKQINVKDVLDEQAQCEDMNLECESQDTNRPLCVANAIDTHSHNEAMTPSERNSIPPVLAIITSPRVTKKASPSYPAD